MRSIVAKYANVTDVVRDTVSASPDRVAIRFVPDPLGPETDDVFSFGMLDEKAREIAAMLQHRLPAGSRVLLLYPEGTAFSIAFLGCAYAGMVAVPAPLPGKYSHQRRRIAAIADDADVALILTCVAARDDVTDWAADMLIGTIVTDADPLPPADDWRRPDAGPDELVVLQYTSGSTGDPRGVMITHGNVLHNVDSLTRTFGLGPETGFGGWLPHYHDMSLMAVLLPSLMRGGSLSQMAPTTFLKRPQSWLRLIDAYDVQWSPGPNFAYELCTRQITDEQVAGLDLSRWTYAANGSEPVRASTLTGFTKRFAPYGLRAESLLPCYGMAEATVFVSGSVPDGTTILHVDVPALERDEFTVVPPDRPGRDLVSCGPVTAHDVRIVDPATGALRPADRIGEIWLRGPSVSPGYWRHDEATAAAFGAVTADGEKGFLRTGDLGVVHGGEIFVTGRIKELVIIRGRNIYPQDIEHELRQQHDELKGLFGAAFTVTVPTRDAAPEHLVVAHEVRGRPDPDSAARLIAGIRQTVAREFGTRPAAVLLLRRGAVSRTTSGKIQRAGMRQQYLEGALAPMHADVDPAVADLVAERSE